MLKDKLKNVFDDYPDFPKKGILFKDLLPVLTKPELFHELINSMSSHEFINDAECIVAIDARGFIFGTAISLVTKKPLITARKPGKLPGELLVNSYQLEYGENSLCIQKKYINKFNTFCIVDDLLATGGTASAVEKMLTNENKKITGLSVVVELDFLKGRSKLNCGVNSQILL